MADGLIRIEHFELCPHEMLHDGSEDGGTPVFALAFLCFFEDSGQASFECRAGIDLEPERGGFKVGSNPFDPPARSWTSKQGRSPRLEFKKSSGRFDGDERIFAKGMEMVKEIGDEIDGAGGLVAVKAALAMIVEDCGLCRPRAETICGIGIQIAVGRHDEARIERGLVH